MLVCVVFGYVQASSVEDEISQEEGAFPLTPSSAMLRLKTVWVVMPNCSSVINKCLMKSGFEVVVDVEGAAPTTS